MAVWDSRGYRWLEYCNVCISNIDDHGREWGVVNQEFLSFAHFCRSMLLDDDYSSRVNMWLATLPGKTRSVNPRGLLWFLPVIYAKIALKTVPCRPNGCSAWRLSRDASGGVQGNSSLSSSALYENFNIAVCCRTAGQALSPRRI